MREAYPLASFLAGLDAWELHREQYLKALEMAHQPPPQAKQLASYRNVWIEGWLEGHGENEVTTS